MQVLAAERDHGRRPEAPAEPPPAAAVGAAHERHLLQQEAGRLRLLRVRLHRRDRHDERALPGRGHHRVQVAAHRGQGQGHAARPAARRAAQVRPQGALEPRAVHRECAHQHPGAEEVCGEQGQGQRVLRH